MTERDRKRQMKAAFKAQERAVLTASMPIGKEHVRALFAHLDRAGAPPCDHTLRDTTQFLESRGLDPKAVIPWLHHHGGYCDCEVIANVWDKYAELIDYRPGV